MKKDLKNIAFTVIGGGRSGIAAAKLIKSRGGKVFLSEILPENELKYFDSETLKSMSILYETGKNSERIYECDYMIISPGVPPSSDIFINAISRGIKVISEIELAYWLCENPIVAVTGTNGKTTTTELIGVMLKDSGRNAVVCGNVGLAFSEIVNDLIDNTIVVLETSSFQLETTVNFRPAVSVITNITSDHIDWHGSFENYVNAKLKINYNQTEEDYIVFNYDDTILREKSSSFKGKLCPFTLYSETKGKDYFASSYIYNDVVWYGNEKQKIYESVIPVNEIYLPGKHNVANAMAAILVSKYFDVSTDSLRSTLKNFTGVEHRIEFVRELNGVKYFNDSKATNFDSLIVALESFKGNIVLIMGGKKGDNNFPAIEKLVKERVKNIIAIGQSSEVINSYFKGFINVSVAGTLSEAVEQAFKFSNEGDIVLFSPGYKSFDMFDNFEHRGVEFKKFVKNL